MTDSDNINLHFINGTAYVWNVQDWRKIRENRIIGCLVGNLPKMSFQVSEPGFPMALTKNETTLLLRKGLVSLKNYPSLSSEPKDDVLKEFHEYRKQSFRDQIHVLKSERKKEVESMADKIVRGKLAKRRKLDPSLEINEDEEREKIIMNEVSQIPDSPQEYLMIQIPTEDCWPGEAMEAEWSYPQTEKEQVEYAVFEELWSQGYWVTQGGKYGVNYMAYPGDPILYHARFLVLCVTWQQKIDPLKFISLDRLAHTVKKTAVFASVDDSGKVKFQSSAWSSAKEK